jgi:hypothetical protein
MNKPAMAQVRTVARLVALTFTVAAAVSCKHAPSTVPEHEPRTDAEVPLIEDAGTSARDAAVRAASTMSSTSVDAATTSSTSVDAAMRAPIIDAAAFLCAGTVCVAPAQCETHRAVLGARDGVSRSARSWARDAWQRERVVLQQLLYPHAVQSRSRRRILLVFPHC